MGFLKDFIEIAYLVVVMIIILVEAIYLYRNGVAVAAFTLLIALTGFGLAIVGYYLFEHFERDRTD